MARNLFGTAAVIDAGRQGRADANEIFDDIMTRRASSRAAPKIAAGDYAGAAGEYGSAGLADEALALRGKQEGADKTVYDRSQAEQTRKSAMQAKQAQALIMLAKGVRGVQHGVDEQHPEGRRRAAIQQVLPIFEKIGVDPTPFASLTEDQITDDLIAVFAGEMEKQFQGVNLGNGGFGSFDNRTGDFKTIREPDPKLQSVAGGATLYDPETRAPVYTAPKTFAPPRPRSGGGAAPQSSHGSAGGKPWERKW